MSALSGFTPTLNRTRTPFPANQVGALHASAPAGVTVEEYGIGLQRQTVIRFTNVSMAFTRASGTNANGFVPLYTIAIGPRIKVDGVVTNITATTTHATDAAMVSAVGTASAANDNALTSTEADLVASATTAVASSAFTMRRAGSNTLMNAAFLDGTSAAISFFLNFATGTDVTASQTFTLNGTITFTWHSQGPVN